MILRLVLVLALILIGSPLRAQCGPYLPLDILESQGGGSGARFGRHVDVDGDVAVIGVGSTSAGFSEVYRHDGTNWLYEATLTPSVPASFFGNRVSVRGDLIVVGAAWANGLAGAAYVYRFDGTTWNEEQILTASDAASQDIFGSGVAVDGDVIIVGAHEDDDLGPESGSAYVFRFDGTEWIEEQKLTASDGTAGSDFGWQVDLRGNLAIVGAPEHPSPSFQAGAAYVFRFDGVSWVEEARLEQNEPDTTSDLLGQSVAIFGDIAVAGASGDDFGGVNSCGAAWVYRHDGSDWVFEQKLGADDAEGNELFGFSVSARATSIAVGAPFDSGDGVMWHGSAYAFEHDGTEWVQEQKFQKMTPIDMDLFGVSVAIEQQALLSGVLLHDTISGDDFGGVFVYERNCISDGFLRGDANGDGMVDGLIDGIFLLNFQFVPGSAEPPCFDAADVDDDETISGLLDGLMIFSYQFIPGSPPPPAPGPDSCGPDPAGDTLECATLPPCP